MSVQALSCAMAMRGVSPGEKLLLLALANYADEGMRCWPSQKRLADDTCLTARTVRSLLVALEAKSLISREQRDRDDGSRSTDLITLHLNGNAPSFASAQISGGAEMISGGVGKQFPGGAEMISGLTTFEPSTEPSEAEASSVGAPIGKKPAKLVRGTRLPEDWTPDPGELEIARNEGLTDEEITRAATEFRNYWCARSRDATKLSWPRTWHNRIIEIADRKRRDGARLAASAARSGGNGRGANSFADIYARRHGFPGD